MTSQDIKDLIDYVMEHNSWKVCSAMKGKHMPKYLDFTMNFTLDTRDGIIFSVGFRSGEKAHFSVENEDDLKEVYKWLDKQVYTPIIDDDEEEGKDNDTE